MCSTDRKKMDLTSDDDEPRGLPRGSPRGLPRGLPKDYVGTPPDTQASGRYNYYMEDEEDSEDEDEDEDSEYDTPVLNRICMHPLCMESWVPHVGTIYWCSLHKCLECPYRAQ